MSGRGAGQTFDDFIRSKPGLSLWSFVVMAMAWSPVMAKGKIHVRARDILAQEARLSEGLDQVDREIAKLVHRLAETQRKEREHLEMVEKLGHDLRMVDEKMTALRGRIEQRLRSRVRMNLDEVAWRRMLLTGVESNRILRTRGYVAAILKSDLALMEGLSTQVVNLGDLRVKQTSAVAALRAVEAQLDQRRNALEEEREVKSEVIRVVRSQKHLFRALAKARAQQRSALRLEKSDGGLGLTPHRGTLPRPTSGPVTIPFGPRRDLRLKTTVFSNGWSMDAPAGSPVRAIFDGDVVYSGWYAGFGNLVIVDHGAGHHTLYAHLQSIRKARGEKILQGTLLGEVGETGSLRGPHLYFELRIRKRPVNPRYWIGGNPRKP